MALTEDRHCRIIKLGGYVTQTWFFFGEKRRVPVTFAFEVEYRGSIHSSGTRMSTKVYEQLSEKQMHTPVYALSVGNRHWWWYRHRFYSTRETYPSPEAIRDELTGRAKPQARETPASPPPRREPPNSPYALLDIPRTATFEEIKQAYRQRIAEYHPDKVANLGVELRRVAEEMTRRINNAYEQLKATHDR